VNNLEQNIGFLSTTFARSQNALETIENLNSYHYTKADVITIADHPSKSIYLSDLLTRANTDLTILKPDLN
jgi:predicted phosphatase